MNSARGRALIGTWKGVWHEVRRDEEGWKIGATHGGESDGIYSMAELRGLSLVFVVGTGPTRLWIYDLEGERAWPLEAPGLDLYWAVPVGTDRVLVVGRDTVASYRFERQDRAIEYAVSVGLNTDLGAQYVVSPISGSSLVASGNGRGELLLVDPGELPDAVLLHRRLEPSSR